MRYKKLLLLALGSIAFEAPLAYAQQNRPVEKLGVDDTVKDIRLRPSSPDNGFSREKPQDQLQRVIDYNKQRDKQIEKQKEEVKGTSEEFNPESADKRKKARINAKPNSSLVSRQEEQGKLVSNSKQLEKRELTLNPWDAPPVAQLPQESQKSTYGRGRASSKERSTQAVILMPSVESLKKQKTTPMSDPRTGKTPLVDKVQLTASKKEAERVKPLDRTSMGRVMTKSEQDLNSKNSRLEPFARPLPPRSLGVLTRVERMNEQGKQLSNANPYAAGAMIDPLSGRVIPRLNVTSKDDDKTGSILGPTQSGAVTAPALEKDAYAPTGIKNGALTFMPALEIATGYDDNPNKTIGGKGALFTTVAPEISMTSDLQRHSITADLRGSVSEYQNYSNLHRATVTGRLGGRIDISSDQILELEMRGRLLGEQATAANYGAPAGTSLKNEPLTTSYGGTAAYSKEFNRLVVTLKAMADRTLFGEAKFSDGTTISGSERDFNAYRGSVRASYLVSEHIRPFIEGFEETRIYDTPIRNGIEQGSQAYGGKVGVRFEAQKRFMGEIGLGYQLRHNKDASYKDVGGLVADGSLVYMPSQITTLTGTVKTSFDESANSAVSTIYRQDIGLQVDHALRRNMIASGKVGYGYDSYAGTSGHDQRASGSLALIYKISTALYVRGEAKHERSKALGGSTGLDYSANIFSLGLRVQR